MKPVPVIDLFAGPGGLSEGFARTKIGDLSYDIRLSIEKDEVACRTLRLRAFARQFPDDTLPEAYYEYIRGDRSKLSVLERMPQWRVAESHVRQWTLGESNPNAAGYVSPEVLHATIDEALDGSTDWVLLGGPPCQAYSVMGRARMTGVGARVRSNGDEKEIAIRQQQLKEAFSADSRHTLYREYLRIVAVHQPAIFVMENVKGILSSILRIGTGKNDERFALDQILDDLRDPWAALAGDPRRPALEQLAAKYSGAYAKYHLYSFVSSKTEVLGTPDRNSFVIRSEEYGVPQRRHRVIVLGIRADGREVAPPLLRKSKDRVSVRQILSGMPKLRSALSISRNAGDSYRTDSAANWCAAIAEEIARVLPYVSDKAVASRMERIGNRRSVSWSTGEAFFPIDDSLKGAPHELATWLRDRRLGGVIQHVSRSHMPSDLARYLFLAVSADQKEPDKQRSPRIASWPAQLLPRHSNVNHKAEKPEDRTSGFHDRFKVQVWDSPASTITSHIHKDGHYFIHPDPAQCRSLTVREAARLQTFPENYFFEGNRSQQFIQVGNAVPPFLAAQLAEVVAKVLVERRRRSDESQTGETDDRFVKKSEFEVGVG